MRTSRRPPRNGTVNLTQAMAHLVELQAALLKQASKTEREMLALKAEDDHIRAEMQAKENRIKAEMQAKEDRFRAEIQAKFDEIMAILLRHERILNDLPEVIKQKIGFRPR